MNYHYFSAAASETVNGATNLTGQTTIYAKGLAFGEKVEFKYRVDNIARYRKLKRQVLQRYRTKDGDKIY